MDSTITAIKQLKIRGAPAIGIVAAYALYITAIKSKSNNLNDFINTMDMAAKAVIASRPTAVNLAWAVKRIQDKYHDQNINNSDAAIEIIRNEAISIHNEDKEACRQIGLNGLEIIKNNYNILTHCNTGSLATGGWGTALGIIYAAFEEGINIHVFIDETRPLGQGARLTFWELKQNNIPCTLLTDSTAASLMQEKKIDLVIFGADRIARNGDVANKIGSYGLAVLAYYHKIPCFSAAPLSTFDLNVKTGSEIIIEQRTPEEILNFYNFNKNMIRNCEIYNPAFDITPAQLLTGIITEHGIFRQPLEIAIHKKFLNN